MIIDSRGAELPPWRRRVAPIVMALVRLGVGYLLIRRELAVLVFGRSFLDRRWSAVTRDGLAAALILGVLAFVVPRTVLFGALLLAAALGTFEYLWRQTGNLPGNVYGYALALLLVLTASEYLVRYLQKRIYTPLKPPT